MVDASELDTISPASRDGAEPVVPAEPVGFFSTPTGRIVLIVGGITILLVILAIVVVVVLGMLTVNAPATGTAVTPGATPPAGVETSGSVEATAVTPPEVRPIKNIEVFSPRDPFEPVEFPRFASTDDEGGSEERGVLSLIDIVTEDGVRKAVLRLDGVTYTVGAGQRLGETPWQVQSVGSTSVRMLYGDEGITLSLGQGISSK